ncbi:MAG: hypothetical protein F6K24_15835 [Okeania sp. SIO2D1]|nr:hypothetical protein [Okeania sp. SIO2C9]NEQ74528.1 hypothetical protein [Okeania sp. SIO2C9]NES66618.1 hypothetical protein [Okeania sp. SIO2D1]
MNNLKYLLFNSLATTKKYKSYPRISNAKLPIYIHVWVYTNDTNGHGISY